MRTFTIAVLASLAVACGGGMIPRPRDEHVTRARMQWPGATKQSLERGRSLYVARCSGCHPLHAPESFPAERWTSAVAEMAPRAHLSDVETELVLRYLLTMSRR